MEKASSTIIGIKNIVAEKSVSAVLSHIRKPSEVLMIEFAKDTLSYIDIITGDIIGCQVFVATSPYSDYAFALAIPSQKIEDLL